MKLLSALAVFVCLAAAQDPPPPVAPVITWAKPGPIRNPAPLGPGQLNATASVPGTFTYDPPAGTVLDAGQEQALRVTFTPADMNVYTPATALVFIDVIPQYWPYDPGEHFVCDMQADLSAPVVDADTGLPRCFVVPVAVSTTFAKHLLTQTNGMVDGKVAYRYANWWDFIVKYFVNSLVLPMLDQYPPDEITQAKADAEAAAKAIDAAKAALLGVDPATLKDGGGSIAQPGFRNVLTPAAPAPAVP